MYHSIAVLGSTGSVGRQTLDVAELLGLEVDALTADSNLSLLEEQARRFRPRMVALRNKNAAAEFRCALRDTDIRVYGGEEGVRAIARETSAPVVCNSICGVAGLVPTLEAIRAGHDIALSNKETLVAAGQFVMAAAREKGVKILPVDSEHSAIFQCLTGRPKKLILTCSGGPFYGCTRDELSRVTRRDALAHPTWKMGPKITVDCSTLMNKGFEVLEASWLFDLPASSIDVLIHRESIVHSMVQYPDNSILAQLSVPDMRLCVQYALTWPERFPSHLPELDLTTVASLSFRKPDTAVFTPLAAAYRAAERGGIVPAALNAVNERAVGLFLQEKIPYLSIFDVINEVAEAYTDTAVSSVEDILTVDHEARAFCDRYLHVISE